MSWFLFYLLALLHPIVFFLIWFLAKTWPRRVFLWLILPIPALLYCRDFYEIERDHGHMCATSSGLRVLVPLEKSNRVRLVGPDFVYSGKNVLEDNYPRLEVVETLTQDQDRQGRRLDYYVAYTGSPNLQAPAPGKAGSSRPAHLIVSVSKVETLDPSVVEAHVVRTDIPHGMQTTTFLSKSGKTIATYTLIEHWWTGIRYPDSIPTWRCPDPNVPLESQMQSPNAGTNVVYPKPPLKQLLNLVL